MRRVLLCLAILLLFTAQAPAWDIFHRHCPAYGPGPGFAHHEFYPPPPAAIWFGWGAVVPGSPPLEAAPLPVPHGHEGHFPETVLPETVLPDTTPAKTAPPQPPVLDPVLMQGNPHP
jgi:hypothetical protein